MATDWITVEPSLDPITKQIDPLLLTVDSVLSFLISILNIVQAILNLMKAFMVGYLDPLRSLVELVIEEVRNLIQDLRQLGVYITGDWTLLRAEDKWSSVIGGYSGYERRMLSRLLDTSDPNRPDFTSSSAVVGVFFYVSSEDANELSRVVNGILKFFGRPDLMSRARAYGTPTAPTMKYGTAGAGVGAFRQLSQASEDAIPDSVSVTWQMPAGVGGTTTAFSAAPKGFLIHVSTIQDGFQVLSLTTKASTSAEVQNLPRVAAAGVDPITNGPLKLYGGIADLAVSTDATDFSSVEHSDDAQAPLLVLQKDQNTPLIRPSLLDNGGIPLIANTYFVKTGTVARLGPGTKFTATFPRSILPQAASFVAGLDGFAEIDGAAVTAAVYYFRVRAVAQDYVDVLELPDANLSNPVSVYDTNSRIYQFSYDKLLEAENGVLLPENPGINGSAFVQPRSITAASGPGVATFPSAVQVSYIQAVQAAVAVAILCRADLTEGDYISSTGIVGAIGAFRYNTFASGQNLKGLEGAGRDLLARYGIQPSWFKGNRPVQFRMQMRWALARVASDLQTRSPPPESVAELVVSQASDLTNFMWSDLHPAYPNLTILESLGIIEAEGSDFESQGVGSNPFCRIITKEQLIEEYRNGSGPVRFPAFDFKGPDENSWVAGEGSADWSPIIYQDTQSIRRVEFIRNALISFEDGVVLDSAVAVLQLAAAPLSRPVGDTQWIAVRLVPQALVPVDELLAKLDRFLSGVLDGLEGIIDKIVSYIESLQARIHQMQALLNQIQALLHAIDYFRIPSASGLVLVESGTDGLVQGLVSAGNKPSDASSSYGAGVAVVSGGIPSVMLEMIALILGGE